ncbi:MAG: hypothetical protein M3Z97_14225 [Candidatus Dormibacteraeota bacterium]|nr:hypothetical protein [Candidatus Dormibacteraeota bacterium]
MADLSAQPRADAGRRCPGRVDWARSSLNEALVRWSLRPDDGSNACPVLAPPVRWMRGAVRATNRRRARPPRAG